MSRGSAAPPQETPQGDARAGGFLLQHCVPGGVPGCRGLSSGFAANLSGTRVCGWGRRRSGWLQPGPKCIQELECILEAEGELRASASLARLLSPARVPGGE